MSSPTEEHREAAWAIIKASRVFSPEVSPDWPTIREKHKLMEGRIAQALADESEKAEAERDAALAEAKKWRDALASHAIQCPQVLDPVRAALAQPEPPKEDR